MASFGAEVVCETVEYLADQVFQGRRKNVDNPAGLIIYSLENSLPVPAGFMSSRKRRAAEEVQNKRRLKEQKLMQEELAYSKWLDDQQSQLIREHYSEPELETKLKELVMDLGRRDEHIRRMPENARRDVAIRSLRKELASQIEVPSFEEWRSTTEQTRLF